MKEELLARLDLLAAKMGVAAEHLWEVLTRQGIIEGIEAIIWLPIALLVMRFSAKTFTQAVYDANKASYDEDGRHIAKAILCAAGLVVSGIITICAAAGIKYLFNPEYYALKQILDMLAGGE
jgi:hypothetical protein